jgi:hypothetical protein
LIEKSPDANLGMRGFATDSENCFRRSSAMGQSIPLVCRLGQHQGGLSLFLQWPGRRADILAGHFQSTRTAATDVFLLVIQDTTEFTYQREKSEEIGVTKSINSGAKQGGSPEIAHGLRHSVAVAAIIVDARR